MGIRSRCQKRNRRKADSPRTTARRVSSIGATAVRKPYTQRRRRTGQNGERERAAAKAELFGALVDPGANESNLLFGQSRNFIFVIGWRHPHIFITHVRDILDEHAVRALARHDDLAVLTALEHRFQTVQTELSLLLVGSVALDAGLLKHRLDVRRVSYSLFSRRRGNFAGVNRTLFVRSEGRCRHDQNTRQQASTNQPLCVHIWLLFALTMPKTNHESKIFKAVKPYLPAYPSQAGCEEVASNLVSVLKSSNCPAEAD